MSRVSLSRSRWIGSWVLLNIVFAWIIAGRYLPFIGLEGAYQSGYVLLVYLGHISLLAWLAALPLFLLATAIRRSLLITLAVLWGSSLQLLLLLDTFVYAQYRFHLSGFILDLLINAGSDVFSFSWLMWLLGGAGVLVMIGGQWLAIRLLRRWPLPTGVIGAAFGVCLVALFGVHGWHAWAEANYDQRIISVTRHIPVFHPATAKRFFAERGWVDASAVRERASLEGSERGGDALEYPLEPLVCEAPNRPMNLLVLLVDSMRHDVLNAEVTPFLHSLRGKPGWVVAEDHYSGGNSTKAGVFSLFYGLPVNYWDAFTAARRPPVLMEQLESSEYQFQILSSATLLSPAFDRNVFAGLENIQLAKPAGAEKWERDRNITSQWLDWHDRGRQSGRPYFGFLFFDSVHGRTSVPEGFPRFEPYWETVNFMALGPEFDREPFFNRHRTAVRYVDGLVREVIERLETSGELQNTVVIVTSDHGESYNDHGQNYWGHNSNYSREQVKVPLLMHVPGAAGATLTHKTHHFDIVPTIMEEMFGCESSPQLYSLGHNMLADPVPRQWMLAGSYMGYGILLSDVNIEVTPAGTYQVYDYSMREVPAVEVRGDIAAQVLEALSRFYR